MNRIDMQMKKTVSKIWPVLVLVLVFFFLIFPVAIFRKILGIHKISQRKGVGSGWSPVSHDTADKKGFYVTSGAGHMNDPFLSSSAMFRELRRVEKIPLIFSLYIIMCRLPQGADEKETPLPTDHYAMF